jgi:hypothetical protein
MSPSPVRPPASASAALALASAVPGLMARGSRAVPAKDVSAA